MTQYPENNLSHPVQHAQPDSDTRQPPLKRENEVVPAGVPVDTQTQDNLLAFESERKDQTDVFDVDVALKSVTSELSPELLGDIRSYVELPDSTDAIRHIQRAEFLPHLFRLRGKPYSLKDRELFNVMYDNEYVPETVFMSARQLGKTVCRDVLQKDCLHPVRKPDGSRFTEEDLHTDAAISAINDDYYAPDRVSFVWKDYSKPMIRIHTRFGNEIVCSKEHMILTDTGYVRAVDLKLKSRVVVSKRFGEFSQSPLDIPLSRIVLTAYVIGDGTCNKNFITLTSACDDVLKEAMSFFPEHVRIAEKRGSVAKTIVWRSASPMRVWLGEDGLLDHKSDSKFIPDWVYKLNREQTILFISRLWATDGCIKSHNNFPDITYCSISKRLISDVRALLSKFGILTSLRSKIPMCNGKRCKTAYEIRVVGSDSQKTFLETFSVPGKPPVKITGVSESNRITIPKQLFKSLLEKLFDGYSGRHNRLKIAGNSLCSHKLRLTPKYAPTCDKIDRYLEFAASLGLQNRQEYHKLHSLRHGDVVFDSVKSIEDVGIQDAFDLETENYHNFIVDGIVVHNSLNLSRSEVLDAISVPELQLLYVAPLQSQTQRYSTLYLNEAIQSCELARCLQSKSLEGTLSDSKIVTAVGHQSFANGSGIQLTYAKTSPDRARGIFADRIDFDEVQDQLVDNIPIIAESLTASKWGIRKYTGTAKTVDNTIEHFWQLSSKCEWVMKCEHCGSWNIPNMEGHILDMIQADGVHCVYCGGRLNTRLGEWVPEHPDRMKDFRGYHLPQIVMPAIAEDPESWAKIVRKVLRQPLPIILQECLGISYSVGSRIITEADIKRQCVLPGIKELEQWKEMYAYRVLAIDWGGAEQSSFTVCVVLGIRTDGRIDVLWAKRYIGFDPDDVFVDIAQTYKYYKCHAAAADYGMGFDKNIILEKRFGIKMTQFMFVRQNKLLTYSPSLGHARWTIDKTTALDILFMSIKNQRVYFPPYDTFEIYLRDLLSPYEEVNETGGFTTRRYLRDPSRPDDFCMSLCFGVMLAMKMLYGDDEINIIPAKAFGGGNIPDGAPVDNPIDPQDVMSSLG